jgi:hypothetical protein
MKSNQLFSKGKLQMNLQLFASIWGPNGAPETPNPLMADAPVVSPEAAPVADPLIAPDPAALLDTPQADPVVAAEPVAPVVADVPVVQAQEPVNADEIVAKMVEAMKAQAPLTPEVNEPELTPEQLEEANAMKRDAFLDDPTKFLEDFKAEVLSEAENGFSEKLAPYEEREKRDQAAREFTDKVDAFKASTPDFGEYVDDMAAYLDERPHLEALPDALEIAYDAVKGRRGIPEAPAVDQPGSEEYITKASSDPAVMEAVKKAYLQELKDGQPPVVVKGTGNLGMPTTPTKPKSIKEASSMFNQSMYAKGQ